MTARPLVWMILGLVAIAALVGLWQTTQTEQALSVEQLIADIPSAAPATRMEVWSAVNEGGTGNSPLSGTDHAATFDAISAAPGAYVGQVRDMKLTNADLRLLVYMNGAFAQSFEEFEYPMRWYARDDRGDKIQSVGYGNWLMKTWSVRWQQDRADQCASLVRATQYDGCMLDVLGRAPLSPGYLSGMPVDPSRGESWHPEEWLQNSTALITRVKATVGKKVDVVVNGLGNGTQFFDATAPTSTLLEAADGAVAEAWLRPAMGDIDACPSADGYERDLRMVELADDGLGDIYVLTKVWVEASEQEISRWERFSFASYLLAANANTYFSFSSGRSTEAVGDANWLESQVGVPLKPRDRWNGLLVRPYSRGIALVNLQREPVVVDVPAGFTSLQGDGNDDVVLEHCDGEVLLRPRH